MLKKKRAAKPEQERRVYSSSPIKVRSAAGGKRTIYGYATKFTPVQSADLGGFVEEIHPNAFDECLRSGPDVRALWNHDANQVLGRTKSGTLRLSTNKVGLLYEIDPPDTNLARDLMTSMDRGDVDQSSFGFFCIEDSWREGPGGNYIRTVLKANLFDVSPVTFPAYPDATSGVRASLRNAPESLRSKLTKRDDDADDSVCDPSSPDYDPESDDCDEDRDSDCDCECSECSSDAEDGCTRCVRSNCDLRVCARGGCPAAGEAENLRLRLRIHQYRAKSSTTR